MVSIRTISSLRDMFSTSVLTFKDLQKSKLHLKIQFVLRNKQSRLYKKSVISVQGSNHCWLLLLFTAIEFSPGGSSPYTSIDKKIIYINETIKKRSTNNTKHSKYKYTYYQNTHT